ncbi:MAG: hydroxymethylbilane synthase [Acetobacterales bacterium]
MSSLANRLPVRLGTRASRLALIQTAAATGALREIAPELRSAGAVEEVHIRTTGDAVLDRPLAEIGGKGLFAKEIDTALLGGTIDVAVHSYKDLETVLPDGICIAAVLPRADVRDALVARGGETRIVDLPRGARLGTSSLRRAAQALALRPDIRIVPLRGNVETRLGKVEAGEVDAAILALAGLDRLGLAHRVTGRLDPAEMLPAAAQGAVALACRADDDGIRELLARTHDRDTGLRVDAERAMLAALDGSCQTPIGGLAELDGDRLILRGLVATEDGRHVFRDSGESAAPDGIALGYRIGAALRAAAGTRVFP